MMDSQGKDRLVTWETDSRVPSEQQLIERSEAVIRLMQKKRVHHGLLGLGAFALPVLVVLLLRFADVDDNVRHSVTEILYLINAAIAFGLIVRPVMIIGGAAVKATRKGLADFKAHRFEGDYTQFVQYAEDCAYGTFPFFTLRG